MIAEQSTSYTLTFSYADDNISLCVVAVPDILLLKHVKQQCQILHAETHKSYALLIRLFIQLVHNFTYDIK